ncbi:MAG: tRNA 2-thiouridine(34) synthase MnmA [Patescibacteria group bacterium]|jgi:tRNA-specific 2-thiouridylase|nr:tRNA 2-thiouridine(34) synthase MnmA [Patescibacteria group bacterium]
MTKENIKVIIAMSGGVDSSVVASLLSQKYTNLMGIFLHFWKDNDDKKEVENKCCSTKSLMDARAICEQFGFPLYTLNFSEKFKKEIVDYFLDEYKNGRTPNPCVKCNKFIKLGLLIERAKELGYDYVASGHYAIVKKVGKKFKLLKAIDETKDQSYFLYTLNQEQLSHLLFPLGGYRKTDVRKIAEKMGLAVAQKKDSQEICFIAGKSHNDFLKKHLKLTPGDIVDMDGNILGKHNGLPLYTIGQRKGIELGGDGPYYVTKFDYKKNILFVTNNQNDLSIYRDSFLVENINWISGDEPNFPLNTEVVTRYHSNPEECEISKKNKNQYLVKLKKPVRAITPGQSAVFYRGDEVLGGGIISGYEN